jgi:hypothetical protein
VQAYDPVASLQEDVIGLYGEAKGEASEVTVWPRALGELPQQAFSIVLNQDAMPEMDRDTVAECRYPYWLRRGWSSSWTGRPLPAARRTRGGQSSRRISGERAAKRPFHSRM